MEGHSSKQTYKPNFVLRSLAVTVIPLAGPLLAQSSATYPKVVACRADTRGIVRFHSPPYLVLLRVGFALPHTLLHARCALTAPFHPYRAFPPGGIFSV